MMTDNLSFTDESFINSAIRSRTSPTGSPTAVKRYSKYVKSVNNKCFGIRKNSHINPASISSLKRSQSDAEPGPASGDLVEQVRDLLPTVPAAPQARILLSVLKYSNKNLHSPGTPKDVRQMFNKIV
jgi:hypothetical protein